MCRRHLAAMKMRIETHLLRKNDGIFSSYSIYRLWKRTICIKDTINDNYSPQRKTNKCNCLLCPAEGRLRWLGHGSRHDGGMGEGEVTNIAPETRLKTVQSARESGLLIGTCVEPIGPEHEVDEIVEKIIIGRDMKLCYSGAMRRINIPGSEMEEYGMLTEYQMAFIVAVVRLSMGRNLMANCTHEPNLLGATTGANLFWSEVGTNPRDTEKETSEGRGLDVFSCKKMFLETDYDLVQGPSIFYSENNGI